MSLDSPASAQKASDPAGKTRPSVSRTFAWNHPSTPGRVPESEQLFRSDLQGRPRGFGTYYGTYLRVGYGRNGWLGPPAEVGSCGNGHGHMTKAIDRVLRILVTIRNICTDDLLLTNLAKEILQVVSTNWTREDLPCPTFSLAVCGPDCSFGVAYTSPTML